MKQNFVLYIIFSIYMITLVTVYAMVPGLEFIKNVNRMANDLSITRNMYNEFISRIHETRENIDNFLNDIPKDFSK